MLVLCIVAAVLTLLGIFIFIRGWRGVRIDDHPLCPKCRFDLIANPTTRCPECGANTAKLPPVIGHRRRDRKKIGAGGTMIALGLAPIIGLIVAAASGASLQHALPFWALRIEERSRSDTLWKPAISELNGRLQNGALSADAVGAAVSDILARQANPMATWDAQFGKFIESVRSAGQLSNALWQQYLCNAVRGQIVMIIRPAIAPGDSLYISLGPKNIRAGGSSSLWWGFNSGVGSLSDNAIGAWSNKGPVSNLVFNPGGFTQIGYPISLNAPAIYSLPTGAHPFHLDYVMALYDRGPNSIKPAATFNDSATASLTLLPPGTESVQLVHDPAITVSLVRGLTCYFDVRSGDIYVNADTPPIDLAYDVYFEHDGHSTKSPYGLFLEGQTSKMSESLPVFPPPGFKLTNYATIDVRLRPSPAQAIANTTNMTRISAEELLFKDVPIPDGQPVSPIVVGNIFTTTAPSK